MINIRIKKAKTAVFLVVIFFFVVFVFVPPAVAALEQKEEFYVDKFYDYTGRDKIIAFNSHIGQRALFYIEQEWWDNLHPQDRAESREFLNNLMAEFDSNIYPRMTDVFGSEWTPGIDNDPRLAILFMRLKENAGGYFNATDEYPRSRFANSNEREMIYVNLYYLKDKRLKSFVAHEFQHVITFYQKEKLRGISDDVWLNEARSEYSATILGYDDDYAGSNLERRVTDFLKKPSDSLTEWQNLKYDYGAINLFMQYLVDHYGQGVLTKVVQSDKVGIASIDAALSSFGYSDRFADVFTNWTVANFLNDCLVPLLNTYCYFNPNLKKFHVSLNLLGSGASFETGFNIKDWAAYWYQADAVSAPLVLKMDFSSDSPMAKFRIPYIIIGKSGTRSVAFLTLENKNPGQKGSVYVDSFGGAVSSVVAIVSNQQKFSGFGSNELGTPFELNFSLTEKTSPSPEVYPETHYRDGSLLRAKGDYKVYVINGPYKRWIQSAEIFNAYPHLSWEDVIEVAPEELGKFQEAWLIRAVGDSKVYEINGDGTKHWLRMSAEQFSRSGRDWGMVYIVNKAERDWYRTGADVIFNF